MIRFLPAFAVAVLLGAVSAIAKPASPVSIDYCHIDYNQGPNVMPSASIALTKSSGPLEIKFVNDGDKVATTVRFGVKLEDETSTVRDVGTFSPGITIHHKFEEFRGRVKFIFAHEPQPKCTVEYIKFADGSTWVAE